MTHQSTTPDRRGTGLRALVAVGAALLGVLGLPLTGAGLLGVGDSRGQAMLCFGLVLLASAVGAVAREAAERAHDRHPPLPVLGSYAGEPALHLPRSSGRGRVSAWTLAAISAVTALGGAFALTADRPGWAVTLVVVAALLLAVAAPWHDGAGGVWFTPSTVAHEHDGVRWQVPWDDVTGSWAHEPVPVLVRPGHLPRVRRTLAAGRHRGRAASADTLWVESRYLAGGAALVSFVVLQGVADRRFRAALGTPESLPPHPS